MSFLLEMLEAIGPSKVSNSYQIDKEEFLSCKDCNIDIYY